MACINAGEHKLLILGKIIYFSCIRYAVLTLSDYPTSQPTARPTFQASGNGKAKLGSTNRPSLLARDQIGIARMEYFGEVFMGPGPRGCYRGPVLGTLALAIAHSSAWKLRLV